MFEFADPNNDPLTLTLSGLPSWASFDGVDTLTGSPSSNDAGMTFNIAATATAASNTCSCASAAA
jgi:hypothetical protein